MLRPALLSATLVVLLGSGMVMGQSPEAGIADTINARRGLMNQLASIQTLIDARLAGSEYTPELYDLGQSAAASLEAFAVLFPTESNQLGGAPAVEGAETTAAPAIWDDLPAFQKLLRDVAIQARTASEQGDLAGFQQEWDKVAQSCASCHEAYVFFDPFAAVN